jgi:hypothetical protein
MANIHATLGGLLVGQIALAAIMWWPQGDTAVELKPLVPGGAGAITKLSVTRSGDDAKPVELIEKDEHWYIASEGEYPADDAKVAEMTDALGKIQLGAPIATQKESYAKLKVDEKEFGRKVTFTADGAEHTLLIGAAKSKAIYLRIDGAPEVYLAKGPSEFVFKDAARTVWKTNYVEFDKTKATSFAITKGGTTWSFKKDADVWKLEGGAEGDVARSSKIEELVGKAAALRLSEPVGKEVKPEYGLETGVRVDYAVSDGDQTTSGSFRIGALADAKHYAQATGNSFVVFVPEYTAKDLYAVTAETLLETIGGVATTPTPAPASPPMGGMPPGMMQGMPPGGMPPGMPPF